MNLEVNIEFKYKDDEVTYEYSEDTYYIWKDDKIIASIFRDEVNINNFINFIKEVECRISQCD